TREAHQGYIRRTIGPVLGDVKVRKLGADSLDSLYTALKKCSRLCGRLPKTEHHTAGSHACDQRCGPLRDHRTSRPHTCDSRCPRAGRGAGTGEPLAPRRPGTRPPRPGRLPPPRVHPGRRDAPATYVKTPPEPHWTPAPQAEPWILPCRYPGFTPGKGGGSGG